MAIKKVFYKSDFSLLLSSATGWAVPFQLRFYTNAPSRPFIASYDGTTYTHCHIHDNRLCIGFDNHGLGLGVLMVEMRFYLNNQCYESGICDEVIAAQAVTITDSNDVEYNIQLSLEGESTLVTTGTLPAYYQIGPQGPTGNVVTATYDVDEVGILWCDTHTSSVDDCPLELNDNGILQLNINGI